MYYFNGLDDGEISFGGRVSTNGKFVDLGDKGSVVGDINIHRILEGLSGKMITVEITVQDYSTQSTKVAADQCGDCECDDRGKCS